MNGTYRDSFEKQWEKFLTSLKGKILKESSKQQLTYPLLNLLLRDARLCWESDYDENGRWLKKYKEENPEKGELIYNILLEDMVFTEIKPAKGNSEIMNYALPVVGAVAGFGISSLLHANAIIKAVSTIAPAALLYTTTKSVGTNKKDNSTKQLIDAYIAQLDKFKVSIISIICN